MTTTTKLSDQQYTLVSTLWSLKEGSARDVQKACGLDLAHTTVGTILTRLEKKGVLASETRGRERIFRPLIKEVDVKRSMVSSLVSTLFKGDSTELLAHLVREGDVDSDELDDIKALLESSDTQEKDHA